MATPSLCQIHGCVNEEADRELRVCEAHWDALTGAVKAEIRIALPACSVKGCNGRLHSTFNPYCEMHAARLRRTGSLKQAERQEYRQHSDGYLMVWAPDHPLASRGRVYEHRMVFADAHGTGEHGCHWCGQVLRWPQVQVDHLNGVRDDNRLGNLVASCGPCNRDRARPAAARAARDKARKHMVNGRWLSIEDAARSLGVSRNSIVARLRNGWSVERAMTEPRGRFGPTRLREG